MFTTSGLEFTHLQATTGTGYWTSYLVCQTGCSSKQLGATTEYEEWCLLGCYAVWLL
jgi:hypothetical protein